MNRLALRGLVFAIPIAGLSLVGYGVAGRMGEAGTVASFHDVTYYEEVSRILEERCQTCHRAGGMAPFALESFEQAYASRELILEAVRSRRMPPWFADPEVGEWANDRRLTEEERLTLLAWVQQGAPAGHPWEAPARREWPVGWTIGEPDVVLSIPDPVEVPASGVIPYRYVYTPTDFPEDRWIQGFEVRPTAPEVVHHVLVFLEEPEYPGQVLYESVVTPGFQIGREGYFAAHVPGYSGVVYPEGAAKLLPRGATLKFQLHYTPHGMPMTDQTEIGFIFTDEPPEYRVETGAAMAMNFVIPPGARNHEVTAVHRFPEPVKLLALGPHMHLRGKAFRFELHYPDGRRETLLDVPRWDFNWQDEYVFKTPLDVPAGSWIRATGWYDNSRRNSLNPDPTQAVRFGEQTFEEMMNGYFHYLVRNPDWSPDP